MEGQEVTEAPTEDRSGKVIDLMAALKASLEKRGVSLEEAEPATAARSESKTEKAHGRGDRTTERKRAGGKK
jgi:hypothetical protein